MQVATRHTHNDDDLTEASSFNLNCIICVLFQQHISNEPPVRSLCIKSLREARPTTSEANRCCSLWWQRQQTDHYLLPPNQLMTSNLDTESRCIKLDWICLLLLASHFYALIRQEVDYNAIKMSILWQDIKYASSLQFFMAKVWWYSSYFKPCVIWINHQIFLRLLSSLTADIIAKPINVQHIDDQPDVLSSPNLSRHWLLNALTTPECAALDMKIMQPTFNPSIEFLNGHSN